MANRPKGHALLPLLLLLTGLVASPASATSTASTTVSGSFSAGYALAFGGLNHLDTGAPVTPFACRFLGSACTVSFQAGLGVAQFDPSLGTLQQVDIRFVASSSFSARIQNRPGFGQPPATGTWTTSFTGTLLSTISLVGVIPNDPSIPPLGGFFPGDPIAFSGFASTIHPFGNSLGSKSVSQTLAHLGVTALMNSPFVPREVTTSHTDPGILAAFTGTGSVGFTVAQHSQGRASSNSNSVFSISNVGVSGPAGSASFINTFIHNFAPTVEVTYTYSIPEPSALLMLGLALTAMVHVRRMHSA